MLNFTNKVIFSKESLIIFTDATSANNSNPVTGCAGTLVCFGSIENKDILEKHAMIKGGQNNFHELIGVIMALKEAVADGRFYNKNGLCKFRIIRIFTDSIYVVNVLNRKRTDEDVVRFKSKFVSDIYTEIVHIIAEIKIPVEVYYCPAHLGNNIEKIGEKFRTLNSIPDDIYIDNEFLERLALFNDLIDSKCNHFAKLASFIDICSEENITVPTSTEYDRFEKLVTSRKIE